MHMSIHLTGSKPRVVHEVQERLDKYFDKKQAYETAQQKVDACAAENVPLTDIPSHEARYQDLLSRYSLAANELKCAANDVKKKTDSDHIDEYFHKRRHGTINKIFHAGPRDKSDIDSCYKGFLKELYKVACQTSNTDYNTPIEQARAVSQKNAQHAQVQIEQIRKQEAADQEYSSIDITFPACQDKLISETPSEYLRQSALYQHKLLQNKDLAAALAFGKSWIKNPPKEATWSHVENMVLLVIEAANQTGGCDLTDCVSDVEKWMEEHPLPNNPDTVVLTSDQLTNPEHNRTSLLGLLYLNNKAIDLSPRALTIYRDCSSLFPQEPIWKVMQAYYHMANMQWLEAEFLLANLQADNPSVQQAQKCLEDGLHNRLYSAGLELGAIALSRLVPLSYQRTFVFDVANTALIVSTLDPSNTLSTIRNLPQLSLNVFSIKELFKNPTATLSMIPNLSRPFRDSFSAEELLKNPSRVLIVEEMVDFIFRHASFLKPFQRFEQMGSYGLRTSHRAWLIYSNHQYRSLPSIVNLVSMSLTLDQARREYQEKPRAPVVGALLSTAQRVASDVKDVMTIKFYSDLLPVLLHWILSKISAPKIRRPAILNSGNHGIFKEKWLFTVVSVGSITAYRFYFDYPYLWAVGVMQSAQGFCNKGNYEEATRILIEAENSYCLNSVKPAVRSYAKYVTALKEYSPFVKDIAQQSEFLENLNQILDDLRSSPHYSGIRNNLLLKKIEFAIMHRRQKELKDVFNENPSMEIISIGMNSLLTKSFFFARINLEEGCSYLNEVGSWFPSRFRSRIQTVGRSLTAHSKSLKAFSGHTLLALTQKPPSKAAVIRWGHAIRDLQDCFRTDGEQKEVIQELQFYKLLISFAQPSNDQQTEVIFAESDAELHLRFSQDLISGAEQLMYSEGNRLGAIHLLNRAQYPSFKEKGLIQDFADFLSVSCLPANEQAPSDIEQLTRSIDSCIERSEKSRLILTFFSTFKIVILIDASRYDEAKSILVQEDIKSRIHTELAAFLFTRLNSLKNNEDIQQQLHIIIEKLDFWHFATLFRALQNYLLCDQTQPLKTHVEALTSLAKELSRVEQLSGFASSYQMQVDSFHFQLLLGEDRFEEAKDFLSQMLSKESRLDLYRILLTFFLETGERMRTVLPPQTVCDHLNKLNQQFASPHAQLIQNYIEFLVQNENAKEIRDFRTHQTVCQALSNIFVELESLRYPIPESLKLERAQIELKIAFLAMQAGRKETARSALETIERLKLSFGIFDQEIDRLKAQLG